MVGQHNCLSQAAGEDRQKSRGIKRQQQPEERRKTREDEVEKWKIGRKTGKSMGLLVTSSGEDRQERRNKMTDRRGGIR